MDLSCYQEKYAKQWANDPIRSSWLMDVMYVITLTTFVSVPVWTTLRIPRWMTMMICQPQLQIQINQLCPYGDLHELGMLQNDLCNSRFSTQGGRIVRIKVLTEYDIICACYDSSCSCLPSLTCIISHPLCCFKLFLLFPLITSIQNTSAIPSTFICHYITPS